MSNKPPSREELLEKMWVAQADAVLRAIASGEPSASTLNVCRLFLVDNGVTLDALRTWRHHRFGHGFDPSQLPRFNDDDSEDGSGNSGAPAAAPNPLKIVAPFVDPDEPSTKP